MMKIGTRITNATNFTGAENPTERSIVPYKPEGKYLPRPNSSYTKSDYQGFKNANRIMSFIKNHKILSSAAILASGAGAIYLMNKNNAKTQDVQAVKQLPNSVNISANKFMNIDDFMKTNSKHIK